MDQTVLLWQRSGTAKVPSSSWQESEWAFICYLITFIVWYCCLSAIIKLFSLCRFFQHTNNSGYIKCRFLYFVQDPYGWNSLLSILSLSHNIWWQLSAEGKGHVEAKNSQTLLISLARHKFAPKLGLLCVRELELFCNFPMVGTVHAVI